MCNFCLCILFKNNYLRNIVGWIQLFENEETVEQLFYQHYFIYEYLFSLNKLHCLDTHIFVINWKPLKCFKKYCFKNN